MPRFKTKKEEQEYAHNWYMNSGRREKYAAMPQEEKDRINKARSLFNQNENTKMMRKHQNWKKSKIIFSEGKEEFNKLYLSTHNCQLCNKEITDEGRYCHSNKKVVDHDHECGHWRFICCHTCNTQMKSYDIRRMRLMCELHRYFNLNLN